MKPISASSLPLRGIAQPSSAGDKLQPPADLPKEQPPARRQSLDNGSPELLALKRQITALEAQVDEVQAKDDLDVAPGDFSHELHRHLTGQRRYDKKATQDHLGSTGWTRMRQAQLGRIPGGEVLAAQYGASFARDIDPSKPDFARLDINNPTNSTYQRLTPDEKSLGLCEDILALRHPNEPPARHVFVNSEYMARKMVARFRATSAQQGDIKLLTAASGIVALNCTSPDDKRALDRLVDAFGGRISSYQVLRASLESTGKTRQLALDAQVDVAQIVGLLKGTDGNSVVAQLRSVPNGVGTAALAHTAAALIDELTKLLSRPAIGEAHQHNPLVACGLLGLHFIAEALPGLVSDSVRFGNAYRAMMEELHVVLAAVRPYNLQSFKLAAAGRVLTSGLEPAKANKLVKPEAFLTTSGMQALTQALDLAHFLGKGGLLPLTHGARSTPFYYEGQSYIDQLKKPEGDDVHKPKSFYAALSDSYVYAPDQKQAHWRVGDVVKGIQEQLANHSPADGPLNVVVDTTIEKEHELSSLLKGLGAELADNRLRLYLCKSHHKYANLGSAKVVGGSLTLVGANSAANRQLQDRMRAEETAQNWFANDESQLLTHITRVAHKQEPKLLQASIDNANFLAEHCFHGQDGHIHFAGHDPLAPFAMIRMFHKSDESKWPGFKVERRDGPVHITLPPDMLLNQDFIRYRSSFGFTESTRGTIGYTAGYDDHMMRLSFGQENKTELIERFWMASRQIQLAKPLLDCRQAHFEVMKLVNDALGSEHRERFKNQPLSARLKFIGQQEAATLSDSQRNQAGVTELRATLATPKGFTLNKVASVVGHLHYMLVKFNMAQHVANATDGQLLHDLLDGFISSGMPGVSRIGQEQAVSLQCELSYEAMKAEDPERRHEGVDSLLAALQHSPVSQNRGLFHHVIPDVAYNERPAAVREKLVDSVFGVLDTTSKLEFLNTHIMRSDLGVLFLEDCGRQFARQLRSRAEGDTGTHWRSTVKQQMISRGIFRPTPSQQV